MVKQSFVFLLREGEKAEVFSEFLAKDRLYSKAEVKIKPKGFPLQT